MSQTAEPTARYEAGKAEQKAEWLWGTVLDSEYPAERLPEVANPNPKDMALVAGLPWILRRTLTRTEDFMEPKRPKIIHAQGAVAMIELETCDQNPYSGVLASTAKGGGAIGLLRMSLAIRPKGKRAITPGFGLKLLIDAKPSLDLLAMNHTVGQGRDYNLMSNVFTHDLREAHKRLRPPQKMLQFFFKRVTKEPRWLSIEHFAETNRSGNEIEAADRNAPKRLIFTPRADVRRLFDGKAGEDFRETLGRVKPGTVLYDIDAVPKEGGEGNSKEGDKKTIRIGRLVATTPFKASEWGDRLFFRHVMGSAEPESPKR